MMVSLRSSGAACAFALLLFVPGCKRSNNNPSPENSTTASAPSAPSDTTSLATLADSKQLDLLRWPDISDYQPALKTFYATRSGSLAWSRDGKPTSAALGFIQAFTDAEQKGLRPEDYDASRWPARTKSLNPRNEESLNEFDVAMTVTVMRFLSDLHLGRINPQHFNFGIDVQKKRYNLAEFVAQNAVDAADVPSLLKTVEPDSEDYRRTEQALAHYLELARLQPTSASAEPLPMVTKPLSVGDLYPAGLELERRLVFEGDGGNTAAGGSGVDHRISPVAAAGLKNYQSRHGLPADGHLTPETVKSLNVPMSVRVEQLQFALERWRWLSDPYLHPRLMVNLPEFLLRGYTEDHQLDFTMRVVVGKVAGDHRTPVFTRMMRYMIFRPYWNVPTDIVRDELAPHMGSHPGYLEGRNYEVVNSKGQPIPDYTTQKVAQGSYLVREKPGPKNSLGLVKFMFPNQYDIYLHSTPARGLFARTRRDFSHGCVRVQQPEDLATWVLDGQKDTDGEDWTLEKVQEAMSPDGEDSRQVNLKTPLPIVIFYLTATVDEDGTTHFFDDIYSYDEAIRKTLEKGPPYPTRPDPTAPKPKPGDTV